MTTSRSRVPPGARLFVSAQENSVTIMYGGWFTTAGGPGTQKAIDWAWTAIEKRTDLWARMCVLTAALEDLSESLRCLYGTCEQTE